MKKLRKRILAVSLFLILSALFVLPVMGAGAARGKQAAVPGKAKMQSVSALSYRWLQINWSEVSGATAYKVYVKNDDGKWVKIGTTSANSFVHKAGNPYVPLKTGVTYTYSVRGTYVSDGKLVFGDYAENTISGNTKPEKAVLKKVTCPKEGKIRITWSPAKGAEGYLIFRKTKNSSWEQVAKVSGGTKASYTHVSSRTAPIVSGATYWYTVKSFAAGGKTVGSYNKTGLKILASPVNYKWTLSGSHYTCTETVSGEKLTGMQKIKGKYYYFSSKGVQQTGWQKIGNDYYYFRIQKGEAGYRLSSRTINGISIRSDGKASLSGGAGEKVRLLAKANSIVSSVSNLQMSDTQRLRACFVYAVRNFTYRDIGDFYAGADWDRYYARYFLEYGYGDCFAAGAGFAYLAAAAGFHNVNAVSSGGHGWADVEGKVSDPDWAWVNNNIDGYFHISYDLSGVGGRPYYSGNRAYVKQIS